MLHCPVFQAPMLQLLTLLLSLRSRLHHLLFPWDWFCSPTTMRNLPDDNTVDVAITNFVGKWVLSL